MAERHPGRVDERRLHRDDDVLRGEDVPLDGVAPTGAVAGPVEALGAGVGRGLAGGGDDAELAGLARVVVGEHAREGVGRRCARLELRQRTRPVGGDACGLRRDRADAGPDPRHDRPDREVPGLHGAADLAGVRVGGDDRERRLQREAHEAIVGPAVDRASHICFGAWHLRGRNRCQARARNAHASAPNSSRAVGAPHATAVSGRVARPRAWHLPSRIRCQAPSRIRAGCSSVHGRIGRGSPECAPAGRDTLARVEEADQDGAHPPARLDDAATSPQLRPARVVPPRVLVDHHPEMLQTHPFVEWERTL